MAGSVSAQSLAAAASFEEYRSLGETRVWVFSVKNTAVGRLMSTVKTVTEINGVRGYVIDEQFALDFSPIGTEYSSSVSGAYIFAADGSFLAGDVELTFTGQSGRLSLQRDGEVIAGFSTRGEREIEQEVEVPPGTFAIDNNLLDQYELYLAMRDLQVGDTIQDRIFVPQTLLMATISGEVTGFEYQQLHKERFDSVFVIELYEPQQMTLYFTRDKQLARGFIPSQEIHFFLNQVQVDASAATQPPPPPPSQKRDYLALIPHYLFYLFLAVIVRLLVIKGRFDWPLSYYALLAGGASFIVVALVQLPLQQYLLEKVFVPMSARGGSVYMWAFVTVIPGGLIQEGLKLVWVFVADRHGRAAPAMLIGLGALFGAGLGVVEACYFDTYLGIKEFLSWNLMERIAMIVFHSTTGAVIGLGWYLWRTKEAINTLIYLAVGAAVVNGFLRSLPVFVQENLVTAPLMYIILSLCVVLVLLAALVLVRVLRGKR